MKTIIVKVHNTQATTNTEMVMTDEGLPNVIAAGKGVNYEFLEQSSGHAPDHVITKRVADDLHITFAKDGEDPDLIIQDFYSNDEQALIGMAEDGSYYYYIPDTSEVADYVTQLASGDIEGQALGGPAQPSPWWAGQSDEGFAVLPWLVGLAGLGLVAAALASDDDNNDDITPDTPEIPKPTLTAEEDGSVTVTPTEEATEIDITYRDEEGNEKNPVFTKDPDTGKWLDNNPEDNVTINPETGEVTIPADDVKDGSEVEATQTTPEGESEPATVIAKDDIPEPMVTAEEDGSVTVIPTEEATQTDVTYTDEEDNEQTATFTKDPNTGKWLDNNPEDNVTVNPETGEVTIPADDVKDGSEVEATQTTPKGESAPATAIAGNDMPLAPAISFEAAGPDGIYNLEEVGDDGTIIATVTVPEGTEVGDVLTINGTDYPVTQDVIDNGQTVAIPPSTEVVASITSAAGKKGPDATNTAPNSDITPPDAPMIGFEDTGSDGVYDSEEIGTDGTITATVTVPEGTEIGDTLTVNGVDYPVTQDIIDKGQAIEVSPGAQVTTNVTDVAGNAGPNANNTAPIGDIDGPDDITTQLVINDVTKDNVINVLEADELIAVTGQVTGEFSEGDEVTLVMNGNPQTGTVDAQGNFSIDVPGSDLVADSDSIIDGSVVATDSAGNTGTITATRDYAVDTDSPDVPTIGFESTGADDIYNAEEVGDDGTITATVTVPEGTEIGDILTINDINYQVTQDILDNGQDIEMAPDTAVTASITDPAGNKSPSTTETAPAADTEISPAQIVDRLILPDIPQTADGGVVINPPDDSDLTTMQVSYYDETSKAGELNTFTLARVDSDNDGTADQWQVAASPDTPANDLQSGVSFDTESGAVAIVPNRARGQSEVTVTLTDEAGNQSVATHTVLDDRPSRIQYVENNTNVGLIGNVIVEDELKSEVAEVVFDGSGTTVSSDGWFRLEQDPVTNNTLVYLTDAGKLSEANDFEVGDTQHNYEIRAQNAEGNQLYTTSLELTEENARDVYSVVTQNVVENDTEQVAFTVTLTDVLEKETRLHLTLSDDSVAGKLDYDFLTFSEGVTYDKTNGVIFVPKDVTTFTISLQPISDGLTEGDEPLVFTIADADYSTTILDTSLNKSLDNSTDTQALAQMSRSAPQDGAESLLSTDAQSINNPPIDSQSPNPQALNNEPLTNNDDVVAFTAGSNTPISLGAGDDILLLRGDYPAKDTDITGLLEGGEGFDTIVLQGKSQYLNLHFDEVDGIATGILGFESYDLTGLTESVANTLQIDTVSDFDGNALLIALLDDTTGINRLFVQGDNNDSVEWYGNKIADRNDSYDGVSYDIYTDGPNNQLWVEQNSGIQII